MAGMDNIGDPGEARRALLRRAVPVLLVLLLAGALASLLYSATNASRDHEQALAEQRRSYEVIALARSFDATMAHTEATLARYVISMDPDTGRLFQDKLRMSAAQLRAIAYNSRHSDWQSANIRDLRQLFDARANTLSEIGLRTADGQKMGALSQFHRAGQAPELARIDTLINAVITAEKERLRERSIAVTLAGNRTEQVGRTSRLLGLVMVVCVLFALWLANIAYTGRRSARLLAEAETARADMLEAAVAARTAELTDAYERLKQETAERTAAEEHLRQLHKMEAVGQLTGGIAHDFNNMLAVVIGGLELARRRIGDGPEEADRHLDNAMEGANRAAALTRRLLAFARAEPLLPQAVDPDRLLVEMADLIDRTIGDQITVRLASGAGGWHIFVDQLQMENAILNLCVNARDAMAGRGVLTIETVQKRLAAGEVGECMAGDHIVVTITDDGCGMTPDVAARVFEPFFTTKPVGKGTGLGLSQIFGFIRQSQGEVRIESEVGKGTKVHLYLPRRTQADAGGGVALAAVDADAVLHPPTRILVVEDDPRVLNQTMSALAELGHLPIACPRAADARMMLDGQRDIGLILTDVLMPDMTGPEMVAALPAIYAHIPILYVTGYAGEIEDAATFGGHEVLRKPYTLMALGTAISVALSGSNHSSTAAAAA
ncbi:MAG: ATP-binding protein [Sphingobium sp.]